jgi:Flp pilus assembly protein CpaB
MSGHKREPAMKWSRTVLTLVLALASTAYVLLKTDERIDVVVAATDLGAGRKITDKDITITACRSAYLHGICHEPGHDT